MDAEEPDEEAKLNIFRDSLFSIVVDKLNPQPTKKHKKTRSKIAIDGNNADSTTTDAAQIAEFSDYLTNEIFPSLPQDLRQISYQALQAKTVLSDKWSLPLSLGTYEEIADLIPPVVHDSLASYGLIEPPKSDVQSFLSPAITAYLIAATAPPPKWGETRVTACEICERDWVPITYHHLIPKAVHTKVMKRGWHNEAQLNSVAWLCRACHSFVHRMASNEELAKDWFTVDRILQREDVQKFADWVSKVRWKKR